MPESNPPPKKTLKDRAKELIDEVFDALGSLLPAPEPELIPVPIPPARPRRRRRF